jgi:hypothetical protein
MKLLKIGCRKDVQIINVTEKTTFILANDSNFLICKEHKSSVHFDKPLAPTNEL